jgi:hypothetical protein
MPIAPVEANHDALKVARGEIGRKSVRRNSESPIPIPETPSVFHPRAQRNAFRRRYVRLQRRSFARENPLLRRSPNSNPLAEIVSDDSPRLKPSPRSPSPQRGRERQLLRGTAKSHRRAMVAKRKSDNLGK